MREQDLLNLDLGTLMRKFSIPCIISLLVGALYNIVDQIFIANASYLGSYGNAANTVVYPLTVVALAVAVMIGDGACAYVSISLGKNEKEKANQTVGMAMLLSVVTSVLLMLIFLIFDDAILTAFGGQVNEATFGYAKEYFFYITLGLPFYMFGQTMNPIIRSDGSPKFAMVATLIGCFANIILDPIFIFPMHMGMAGAAIATVIGQILTAILSVYYIFHFKNVTITKESFHWNGEVVKHFIPLGITSFLSQVSVVVSMAATQNMMLKYGAQDAIFAQTQYAQIPIAVLGIVMKFFQIIISVSVGLAAGCIPIVGYNIGAGRKDRAKNLFTMLLKWEFIVGLVALAVIELFPNPLINLFGAKGESEYYREFAIRSFRIFLCMLSIATINKGTFIYLQSLGKAKESTLLSLFREIILGVALVVILPMFFGLDGVLLSMPASEIITFVAAIFIILNTYHSLQETSVVCHSK